MKGLMGGCISIIKLSLWDHSNIIKEGVVDISILKTRVCGVSVL